jgi:hypothetical protein
VGGGHHAIGQSHKVSLGSVGVDSKEEHKGCCIHTNGQTHTNTQTHKHTNTHTGMTSVRIDHCTNMNCLMHRAAVLLTVRVLACSVSVKLSLST